MNTQEHLQKIKAKCEALLAIAEKRTQGERTQGEWIQSEEFICGVDVTIADADCDRLHRQQWERNATFIASCAGPAEAGWRATIAAINYIGGDAEIFGENTPRGLAARSQLESIIAAWPEELL